MRGPAVVFTPDASGRTRTVTEAEFLEWVTALRPHSGLAVDTETAGLEWDAKVRTVQFGNSERGFAVDVSGASGMALVTRVLALYRGSLIFHNASFDIRRLEQVGIDPETVWPRAIDTHVMAHIINPDRLSFKLKLLAKAELGEDSTDAQKALNAAMAKHGWTFATVPRLVLVPYAVMDTLLTHQLYVKFGELLDPNEWDVLWKEMEVKWAVWDVEVHGLRLDRPYATALKVRYEGAMAEELEWFSHVPLESRICPRCKGRGTTPSGKKVCGLCHGAMRLEGEVLDNPNADAQIARALRLQGWVPTVFTEKSGKPKLDKKVLEQLAPDYELVRHLMNYKRLGKWLSSYVNASLREADVHEYVHATYQTLGAKTGRMSCASPPLQQLPKGGGGEIRRLYIASPGNVIASVDYSAIEMRLAGALSGEPRIIEAYANGVDIYQQFADELGITRPEAKIFVLATLYGATAKKHAKVFGWELAQAYRIVREFWAAYPVLRRWVKKVEGMARTGEPIISGWGRTLKPHAAYAAPNAVIQGTAAEVLKDGLLRLWEKDLLQYVCALVHDETVLDVPRDEAEGIAMQVASVLEDHTFAVPLTAEASVYGESWGDGYAVAA